MWNKRLATEGLWKTRHPRNTYSFHPAFSARRFPARCPRPAWSSPDNPWDRPRSAASLAVCGNHPSPLPSPSPWRIRCAEQRYTVATRQTVWLEDIDHTPLSPQRNWNVREWNGNGEFRLANGTTRNVSSFWCKATRGRLGSSVRAKFHKKINFLGLTFC